MFSDLDYNILIMQLYLVLEDLTNRKLYLKEVTKVYGHTFKRFRIKRNLKRAIRQIRKSLLVCVTINTEYNLMFEKYDIN